MACALCRFRESSSSLSSSSSRYRVGRGVCAWSLLGPVPRSRSPSSEEEYSDTESDEEGDRFESDADASKFCCGLLRVVDEEERESVLLGGLVVVPEELRGHGLDGKILAAQESNVFLAVILALTFVDLVVSALSLFGAVDGSGCPVLRHEAPDDEASEPNAGPVELGDMLAFGSEACLVLTFGYVTLAVFTVEIMLRLRQYRICRSAAAFFRDPFCVLDFALVSIDLVVLLLTVAINGIVQEYPFLRPIGAFASNARILRAVRIFRVMRAVRAARAVGRLSKNEDLFEAAQSGNLAVIARKVKARRASGESTASGASVREQHAEKTALWRLNALGETALHVAAARGHARVVKWLLERKSCESPDPRDWATGATPLWHACLGAKRAAAHVLLAKGADLDLAPLSGEHRGVTAKQLAFAKHWTDLISEAESIRVAEEERTLQRERRCADRRNREHNRALERERLQAEQQDARLRQIEANLERARQRVRVQILKIFDQVVRKAVQTWRKNVLTSDELQVTGTKRGDVLAKRAKRARLDKILLASSPEEVDRRRRKRIEAKCIKKERFKEDCLDRRAANELRLAWRPASGSKKPKISNDESLKRWNRLQGESAGRNPKQSVSTRCIAAAVDGRRPKSSPAAPGLARRGAIARRSHVITERLAALKRPQTAPNLPPLQAPPESS